MRASQQVIKSFAYFVLFKANNNIHIISDGSHLNLPLVEELQQTYNDCCNLTIDDTERAE